MTIGFMFIFNSVMLGIGLAMDAFSVSLANGFADTKMKNGRKCFIALVYAVFQFLMPVIGWFLVHNAAALFNELNKFIPWIALILLAFIGIKMIIEGIREKKCTGDGNCETCDNKECGNYGLKEEDKRLTNKLLFVQGIATSIDALSVGFTISGYNTLQALLSSFIIGFVTFFICFAGLGLGTKFGTKLASNAKIIGGLILIGIGLEIFFS